MNIQTAFIYFFLTFVLVYIVQVIDNKYLSDANKNEKTLRVSLLFSVITWIIIVYFIYKAEDNIEGFALNKQHIMTGEFQ